MHEFSDEDGFIDKPCLSVKRKAEISQFDVFDTKQPFVLPSDAKYQKFYQNFLSQLVTLPNGHSVRISRDEIPVTPKICNDTNYGSFEKLIDKVIKSSLRSLRKYEFEGGICAQETKLWVENYQPKSYIDLLTDERSNRMLLRWLKLWDHISFKRPVAKLQTFPLEKNRDIEKSITHDENQLPKQKIVLVSGVCGGGKTTMVRVIVQHCGFRPLEINLSYENSVSIFKNTINQAKSGNSLLNGSNKPLCIIFDDIDQAPKASIDYLVSYISKRGKDLHPVICICNNIYASCIKKLREISLKIVLAPCPQHKVIQTLVNILKAESIMVDRSFLSHISEKFNGDIRRLINNLQFLISATGEPRDTESFTLNFPFSHSYFDCIKKIFNVAKRSKSKIDQFEYALNFLRSIQGFEYFVDGLFHNYLHFSKNVSDIKEILRCLNYYEFVSIVNEFTERYKYYKVRSYIYILPIYLQLNFSSYQKLEVQLPRAYYDCQMLLKNNAEELRMCLNSRLSVIIHNKNFNSKFDLLPSIFDTIPSMFTEYVLSIFPYITLILDRICHLYKSRESMDSMSSNDLIYILFTYGLHVETRYDIKIGNSTYFLVPDIISISKFTRTISNSYFSTVFLKNLMFDMKKISLAINLSSIMYNSNDYISKKSLNISINECSQRDFFGKNITQSQDCETQKSLNMIHIDIKDGEYIQPKIIYRYHEGVTDCIRKDATLQWLAKFL